MSEKKALELWKQEIEAEDCDSGDEEQMMEDFLKQRKLMKKMKKEQSVQKHTSSGQMGEISWERNSDVQSTKWGVGFGVQKGLFNPIGANFSVGYESRSERKSSKATAKFPF
ncbi:hypothetical protein SKAU_G00344430 [Synaphobranchus kaupii]|uniref:Uncharacterized protein n=1 Tax=Synaphobranchus kaupii TaxID=118154 RepID=A0A9Q1IGL1_SYNKA|nr:hypothetical protein SKAU_G00344430 [Synaphobranchus kaupii]